MAQVRKREGKKGVSWQIDYFAPTGKVDEDGKPITRRVRKSFKKKRDAEAELGKRVSLIAEYRYLDVKEDYKITLKELLDKYIETFEDQGGFSGKACWIKNFRKYFEDETLLGNIRYVDLETYQSHLKRKPTWYGSKRTDASVNREMSCLRHIFSKAVEWEMMEENPFDKGKSLKIKENNKRYRYLSKDEIDRFLDNCIRPWFKDIAMVDLFSGLRKKELLGLKWEQIKGDFIYLSKTKTDEARQVPILQDDEEIDLMDILADIKQRNQLKSEYVFIDEKGNHINTHRLNYALKGTLRCAGIEDFKFHDLRHTFASHFVMNGGSLKALQEMLGHKNITMTMRYAHLSKEHKKNEIKVLSGLIKSKSKGVVTKLTHLQKKVA